MHFTTFILLLFLLISIGIALYNRYTIQWSKDKFWATVFLIITIYSSISVYDQECIITRPCVRWGWIRFGLIVMFIIIPVLSMFLFGKSYIKQMKKKYAINI